MSKDKQGSWSLPTGGQTFSNPYGTGSYSNNNFGFNMNAGTQDYYNQLDAMRKAIYSGLGYTSAARENSLNQWQDTFTKEALRTSQPQLEQSLFDRGLGGSKYYSDSLTDLLSKVGTQGVLNREQLSNQDQQMNLSYLASINPEIQNILNQGNSLTGAAASQWNSMLPYTATWNQKPSTLDTVMNWPFEAGTLQSLFGGKASNAAPTINSGSGGGLNLSSLVNLLMNPYGQGASWLTGYGSNTPLGVQNTGSYTKLPTTF